MEDEQTASVGASDAGGDSLEAPDVSTPSTEAGVEDAGESTAEEGSETTNESAKQSSDPESRLRGLQAAKDREIADIRSKYEAETKVREEHEQAFQYLEQMVLTQAVQKARNEQGDDAAQAILRNYQVAKAQQKLQTEQEQLRQEKAALQQQGAAALAFDLANDPKYKGVKAQELMEFYQQYGLSPKAMEALAAKLAMERRGAAITERKASGADRVGSGAGNSASGAQLFGGKAIAAAYAKGAGKRR